MECKEVRAATRNESAVDKASPMSSVLPRRSAQIQMSDWRKETPSGLCCWEAVMEGSRGC